MLTVNKKGAMCVRREGDLQLEQVLGSEGTRGMLKVKSEEVGWVDGWMDAYR